MRARAQIDWWLVAILILATGLLLWDLGGRSMWWDEIVYVYIEQQPVGAILGSLADAPGQYRDTHPPLYHILMHYWLALAGTSDLAVRLPSALLGVAVVALTYAVGMELGTRKLARVAAFLTAIAPAAVMYLRMGRYYALACALGLLATYLFVKLWRAPSPALWVGYGLVALVMYYTDYMVVSVLAAHALYAALVGWQTRRGVLVRLIGLQLLLIILYLPWISFIMAQMEWTSDWAAADLASTATGYALKIAFPFISFSAGETLFPWQIPVLIDYAVFGLLLVIGVTRRQGVTQRNLLLLCLFILPVIGTIAFVSIVMPNLTFTGIPNRTLFALPYFNLLVASGLVAVKKRWLQPTAITIIAAVAALGLVNYFNGHNFFNPIFAVPAEEMVDYVVENSRPGDVVISREDIGFRYYLRASGAELPHYWTYSAAANDMIETAEAPRLWWVTFGRDRTRQEESEDAYRQLLAANGYQLVSQRGYVRQDPVYRRVKERLLGREAYLFKAIVSLYALDQP